MIAIAFLLIFLGAAAIACSAAIWVWRRVDPLLPPSIHPSEGGRQNSGG